MKKQKRAMPPGSRGNTGGQLRSKDSETRAIIDGVRRLERGLRLAARSVEMATGLSAAQLFVLEHLSELPVASLAELAQRTFTDRSSVSVAVDRLVAARLATRKAALDDRRRSEVRITSAGLAVLRKAPAAPADLLLGALRRLPPAKVLELRRGLSALNAVLHFEDAPLLFADRA